MKFILVLTQYKRNNLKKQLLAIKNQTLKPDFLVVFQNENHIDITPLQKIFNFIHVKSDYNTKYFGRFAYCFTFPVEYCVVMDDDIIPGKKCIESYINQSIAKNALIGGNGRYGFLNKNQEKLRKLTDVGVRDCFKVDFIGHLWCFKKEWLYNMFSIPPYTYDTGEDMHLSFSCKVLKGIDAYVGKQSNPDEFCDIAYNNLAGDEFASFRGTSFKLRENVEKYFIDNYNLKLLENN